MVHTHLKKGSIMKASLVLVLSLLSTLVFAAPTYYPLDLVKNLEEGKLQDQNLKEALYTLLTSEHQKNNGSADTLGCQSNAQCYSHTVLGYDGARKILFGKIHIKKDNNGYFIRDVYCNKIFTAGNANVGPNAIPSNNKINCEHTWPQSKFNRSVDKETQKSDLHHLYPTDSHANGVRGNFPLRWLVS